MHNVVSTPVARGLFAALTMASLVSCAEPDAHDALPRNDPAVTEAPELLAQQTIRPDPDSTYFVEVTANGSGCPQGSWLTRISDDGLVFTTTFSAYEVRVNANVPLDVRDCQLAIRLHTPAGLSFSVQSFSYYGFAFMQEGVRGRQSASYYFQGAPVTANVPRNNLVGPYDNDFLFKDDVELRDAVWSPCGVERDLNIKTQLFLETTQGASGYMNLTSLDGSSLIISLAARQCDAAGRRTDVAATPTQ